MAEIITPVVQRGLASGQRPFVPDGQSGAARMALGGSGFQGFLLQLLQDVQQERRVADQGVGRPGSDMAGRSGQRDLSLWERAQVDQGPRQAPTGAEASRVTEPPAEMASEAGRSDQPQAPLAAAAAPASVPGSSVSGKVPAPSPEPTKPPAPGRSAANIAPDLAPAKEAPPETARPASTGAAASPVVAAAPSSPRVAPAEARILAGPGAVQGMEAKGAGPARSDALSVDVAQRVRDAAAKVSATAPLRSQAQELIERIVQTIQVQARRGGGTVRMQLHPEELGRLKVEMQLRGNVIEARIEVERPETLTLLREHLTELRGALEARGLQVGDLALELASDAWSGGSPDAGGSHAGQAPVWPQILKQTYEAANELPVPLRAAIAELGRLDLVA